MPNSSSDAWWDESAPSVNRSVCPRALLLTADTGSSGLFIRLLKQCNRWHCRKCLERRVNDFVARIEQEAGVTTVYVAELDKRDWRTAQQMLRRKELPYAGVKRHDGTVLLVAATSVSGRSWGLQALPVAELAGRVLAGKVKRVDWCKQWRPTAEDREQGKYKIVDRVQCAPSRLNKVMAAAGFEPTARDSGGVPPHVAAARIRNALYSTGSAIDDDRD
jgi:hypothetical protein